MAKKIQKRVPAKAPAKTVGKAAAPAKPKHVVVVGVSQPPVDGTSRIVQAVGSAASHRGKDKRRANAIEGAMAASITKAAADGVTDNDKIRALQLAAGKQAAQRYDADRAAEAAALAKQQSDAAARTAATAAAEAGDDERDD